MFGLVEWRETGEKCGVEERRIGGVRFLAAGVRRGEGLRAAWSMRRSAAALQRCGIRQCVFPRQFSKEAVERFARRGIQPVEDTALRQGAAAQIACCAMRRQGIASERAVAALCASRVTGEYARAAEALCGSVRYLCLCTKSGGWELSQQLRARLGVAATVEAEPVCTRNADIVLCFDTAYALSGVRGVILPLCTPQLRVTYALPQGIEAGEADETQLLAALYASLAVRAEELNVTAVEFAESEA